MELLCFSYACSSQNPEMIEKNSINVIKREMKVKICDNLVKENLFIENVFMFLGLFG